MAGADDLPWARYLYSRLVMIILQRTVPPLRALETIWGLGVQSPVWTGVRSGPPGKESGEVNTAHTSP